ncbi:thiamine phosphate synthase [Vibrio marisflavi]|uniref:Thiamine-phosphate synthase n=1 Tax=Vibrio marisflavi CECT 7928 TaxID=634439 RepID=A0ABN8E3Y2_9VIBR|nr:thiamine phosphate synthase [Vibrio marisflavi]CAH0539965.1 Thiamine-phosphate synthase [Vibrio marisflavi CECT 7928]
MLSDQHNLYLITPDFESDLDLYLSKLENSLSKGIKLVQLRSKNLSQDNYLTLANPAIQLIHQYNAKVILNGPIELLESTDADGIHLPSFEAAKYESRPFATNKLLSTACHTEEQLKQAERLKADIAIVCPIFKTPSSPKGIPMGWEKFSKFANNTDLPVYALGGLELTHYQEAIQHGATGIAAKRAFWDLK